MPLTFDKSMILNPLSFYLTITVLRVIYHVALYEPEVRFNGQLINDYFNNYRLFLPDHKGSYGMKYPWWRMLLTRYPSASSLGSSWMKGKLGWKFPFLTGQKLLGGPLLTLIILKVIALVILILVVLVIMIPYKFGKAGKDFIETFKFAPTCFSLALFRSFGAIAMSLYELKAFNKAFTNLVYFKFIHPLMIQGEETESQQINLTEDKHKQEQQQNAKAASDATKQVMDPQYQTTFMNMVKSMSGAGPPSKAATVNAFLSWEQKNKGQSPMVDFAHDMMKKFNMLPKTADADEDTEDKTSLLASLGIDAASKVNDYFSGKALNPFPFVFYTLFTTRHGFDLIISIIIISMLIKSAYDTAIFTVASKPLSSSSSNKKQKYVQGGDGEQEAIKDNVSFVLISTMFVIMYVFVAWFGWQTFRTIFQSLYFKLYPKFIGNQVGELLLEVARTWMYNVGHHKDITMFVNFGTSFKNIFIEMLLIPVLIATAIAFILSTLIEISQIDSEGEDYNNKKTRNTYITAFQSIQTSNTIFFAIIVAILSYMDVHGIINFKSWVGASITILIIIFSIFILYLVINKTSKMNVFA